MLVGHTSPLQNHIQPYIIDALRRFIEQLVSLTIRRGMPHEIVKRCEMWLMLVSVIKVIP